MLMLALAYFVLALLFGVTIGSILWVEKFYLEQIAELKTARYLPRLDYANQLAYLTWALRRWPTPAFIAVYEDTKLLVQSSMDEYPLADWDSWWGIVDQLIDMYEKTNDQRTIQTLTTQED